MRGDLVGRGVRFSTGIAVLATLLLAGCTSGAGGAPEVRVAAGASAPVPTTSGSTPEPTMVSTVTVDPRLPSAQQLPAGLLATTDADWLIATLVGRTDIGDLSSDSARAVDLISPEGVRYELPPLGAISLDQWLPGTALGLGVDDSAPPSALVVVDLETGEEVLRPDLTGLLADVPDATSLEATFVGDGTTDLIVTVRSPSAGRTERRTLDGDVVAELDRGLVTLMPSPSGTALLAVDGTTRAPVLLDPETLDAVTLPAGVDACYPSAWLDGTRWLASCGSADPTWLVVEPDGTWRLPVEPGADVAGLTTDADGAAVVAVRSWDGGVLVADTVARATRTAVAPVDTGQAFAWGAIGSAVVGSVALPATGSGGPFFSLAAPVTAWHVADASTTVLVPKPLKGAVSVFPVRAPGAPVTGGWFELGDDGGVWFHPAD